MIRKISLGIFAVLFSGFIFAPNISARDIFSDNSNFPVGSPNFSYSAPCPIGRPCKNADSIDVCLSRKEWHFNEQFNVWVDGMTRCKINSEKVLSVATADGVSGNPNDVQTCVGKREGQIISHGVPSADQAKRWSERCSYLGALGGAGLPTATNTNTSSSFLDFFGLGSSTVSGPSVGGAGDVNSFGTFNSIGSPASGGTVPGAAPPGAPRVNFSPIYDGPGVQVPSPDIAASGIIKEQSLIQLIVFYTNATLPYVSVISVFAFVAAGMFYILSFANEDLNNQAKSMMQYVAIGIIIIISAYTVVNTLLSFALG